MQRGPDDRFPAPPVTSLASLPAWAATALVGGAGLVVVVAMILPPTLVDGDGSSAVATAALGTVLAIVGFVVLARIARVPPATIFLRRPDVRMIRWVGVAVGLATVVIIAISILGDGRYVVAGIRPRGVAIAVATGVVMGLWAGTVEEVFLRGYVLATVAARWRPGGAVAVSAGMFGLLHHAAADTVLGQLLYMSVTGMAGAVFALVTLRARNVWPAVGMHTTWNAIFSPHVVGIGATAGGPTPIVRYLPPPQHPLLGGEVAAPMESPLALGLFLGLAIVLIVVPEGPIPCG